MIRADPSARWRIPVNTVDGGAIIVGDEISRARRHPGQTWIEMTQPHANELERAAGFAVCIRNPGSSASLERHRLYRVLEDLDEERYGLLRVADESGEGYLYPNEFFQRVAPRPVQTLPDATEFRFALCISNEGAEMDLASGCIYVVLPDPSAERTGWIRVIDDSGEDYLYPATLFLLVDVPDELKDDLLRAS